jgi:hypothetical protein
MALPYTNSLAGDTTVEVYLNVDLRSLSVLAPMTGDSTITTTTTGSGTTTGGSTTTGGGTTTTTEPDGTLSPADGTGITNPDDLGESGMALTSMLSVYVDFEYTGTEFGTDTQPFNSVDEALAVVTDGGTIFVAPAVTHEIPAAITKPVTFQLWNVTRQVSTPVATIGDITSCGPDIDSFNYQYLANAAALRIVKDAALVNVLGVDIVNLVPAGEAKAGAIWTRHKVLVERGFDTTFQFRLKRPIANGTESSDGISFVIQNSGGGRR